MLLEFATKNAQILFNGKYYEQIDGVPIGSPLGPTLANVFLCHWDWYKYKRYLDDTTIFFHRSY